MELKTFNGNSYTSKTTSLYWMSPQVTVPIITSKGNNWIMSLSTYIDSGYWGQHGYLIFKWVEWLDFQMFFLEWNVCISNQISLKFVLKDQIDNVSSSVQAMASTPLFEPMMTHLTDTHCWTSAGFFKNSVQQQGSFCVWAQPKRDDVTTSSLIGWAHTQNDPWACPSNQQPLSTESHQCRHVLTIFHHDNLYLLVNLT